MLNALRSVTRGNYKNGNGRPQTLDDRVQCCQMAEYRLVMGRSHYVRSIGM